MEVTLRLWNVRRCFSGIAVLSLGSGLRLVMRSSAEMLLGEYFKKAFGIVGS